MIKNINTWILLAVVATLAAMNVVHWKGIQNATQRTAQLRVPFERQILLAHMTAKIDRYRHTSALFRKMSGAQIEEAKTRLKDDVDVGVQQLNQLNPTDPEKTSALTVRDKLDELLKLSAHLEPALFLRDAYQKPEIRDLHEAILQELSAMEQSARARAETIYSKSLPAEDPSIKLLEMMSGLILFLLTLLLLRNYLAYVRPSRKLRDYARALRLESKAMAGRPGFPSVYADIADSMESLVLAVESHSKERHKFIKDIVSDLKTPLQMLKSGRSLDNGDGALTEEEQLRQAATFRMGLTLLSGSLDDLLDIVEINRVEARLEEKLVDLSEVVSDVARYLNGSGAFHEVTATLPSMPVWIRLDPGRLERVLFHLVSKIATHQEDQAKRIRLTVENKNGVEIRIYDEDNHPRRPKGHAYSGPEQDLLRHWTSEGGFNLVLAHKIIKAHGGSISAAGVAGASVQFVIRLPQSRIARGALISRPGIEESAIGTGLSITTPSGSQQIETSNLNTDFGS